MNNQNINPNRTKIVIQSIAIIIFIAVCAFYLMKLIDSDSDAISTFFIGFGIAFVVIVLLAAYIKYVVDIYKQIKYLKINHKPIEISTLENEKLHMKDLRNNTNKKRKKKSSKKKNKR